MIKPKHDGVVRYNEIRCVELEDGNNIVLNKNGSISINSEDGRELETHNIVIGSVISVANGQKVKKGDTLDFLTLCGPDSKNDTFRWSPTITMPGAEMPGMSGMAMRWDAKGDFMDPTKLPAPLSGWEELAHVLLLSNEFAVVD